MARNKKSAALYANLILAVIISGLYLILVSPYAVDSVAASGLPIYKGSRSDRVALQCMVTWDAAAMTAILDTLRENDMCITFAVSGEWAERNIGMLKQIANDGHEIATVGYSAGSENSFTEIRDGLSKAIQVINSITGIPPKLFCCTGRNSSLCARAASQLGMTPVMCTLDLVCTNGTGDDIIGRVRGNTKGGDILLVSPTAAFAQALPYIIEYFASEGLTPASISSTIYN